MPGVLFGLSVAIGACAPDEGFESTGQSSEALGYDSGGYDSGGYDSGGYDSGGYDSGGYDSGGYDSGGYDSGGSDGGGSDAGGSDAGGSDAGGDAGGSDAGGDAAPPKCEDTADVSKGDCCSDSDCRRVPGMEICLNFTCQGRKGETPGFCEADPNFSPGEEGALNTCDPGGMNNGMPYSVSCAGPKLPPSDCYVPLGTPCQVCSQAGETNHVDTSSGCTVVPGGMCVDFAITDATGINVIAGPCP